MWYMNVVPTCVVPAGSGQCVGTCAHEGVELLVKRVVVRISRNHTVLRACKGKAAWATQNYNSSELPAVKQLPSFLLLLAMAADWLPLYRFETENHSYGNLELHFLRRSAESISTCASASTSNSETLKLKHTSELCHRQEAFFHFIVHKLQRKVKF